MRKTKILRTELGPQLVCFIHHNNQLENFTLILIFIDWRRKTFGFSRNWDPSSSIFVFSTIALFSCEIHEAIFLESSCVEEIR